MAPSSPACSFIHASMAGSRSTAPSNRSNSVLIVVPAPERVCRTQASKGASCFRDLLLQRLQVRPEGQQAAVAILHHKLTAVPRHVGKSASEFHSFGRILGVKRVRI